MRLYAMSLTAQNAQMVSSVSAYDSAISQDEAVGKALAHGLKKFPTNAGWYAHQVSVVEIPMFELKAVIRANES